MIDDFSDAILILAGHGSTLNANSAAPVMQHAAELRRRRLFAEVRVAFWKQEPSFVASLHGLSARRVFIVPMFISEGYFTEEVLPREFGFRVPDQKEFSRTRSSGGQTFHYCGPIGTHSSMTKVLLSRAREIAERFPFPRAPKPERTTLFIAGHGTRQNDNSRKAIERQVELIKDLKLYTQVFGVFMEEEPRVSQCYELAQTADLVMTPFFMSDGMHSVEDIPILLGAPEALVRERLKLGQPTWRNPTEHRGKRLWYAASVGSEPLIAEVILERVREAAAGSPIQ